MQEGNIPFLTKKLFFFISARVEYIEFFKKKLFFVYASVE